MSLIKPKTPSFRNVTQIGVGASATVYAGQRHIFGEVVAIKTMYEPSKLEREWLIMRRLAHDNVLEAIAYLPAAQLHVGTHVFALSALLLREADCDLNSLLHPKKELPVEKKPWLSVHSDLWLVQCAAAVRYLHAQGIVHRDLHPCNLFIAKGSDHRLLVADFSQAQQVSVDALGCPRLHYTPPEYLLGDDTLTALSEDVWAFALVAYKLISRQEPFLVTASGTRVDVNVLAMHNILLNGHRPSRWSATGPKYDDLWAILERCWRTDPEFRPTMDVVYASLSAILT